MSCSYTINGKQYNEQEALQTFASVLAVPGNEGLSNDQLLKNLEQLTKDRFVDINLFNPYQEAAYTNVIFSEVVNKLGVLQPGAMKRIKASQLFAEIRAAFTNDAKRLQVLLDNAKIAEDYNKLKATASDAFLQKFPEVKSLSFDQLQAAVKQYQNVISEDNWNKFTELAAAKLNRLGLRINKNQIEDYGLSYEYYQNIINDTQDETEDDVDESEREVKESFEDGRAFQINVKDTAATRVKLFFSTIPSVERNMFGKNDFIPYDQIFEDLLVIGSSIPTVDFASVQKALMDRANAKPYLKVVAQRMGELHAAKNTQLINEILSVVNKSYVDHVLVLWNNSEGAGVTTKIISSNRDSVIRQIRQDWMEQQKRSKIIKKDELGDLVVDRDYVEKLQEQFDIAAKSKSFDDKRNFVKTFFSSLNIDFSDKMVDFFIEQANKGFFKKAGATSFGRMFYKNGIFERILKTYAKKPQVKEADAVLGEGDKYNDVNNAMNDERAFNYFADIYFQFNGDKYQAGTFRNGENKTIYSYVQPNYLETVKRKLKNGLAYLNQLKNRAFSASSEVVDQLIKNQDREGEQFTYNIVYADSLKKDKETNETAKVKKLMSAKEMKFDTYAKHQNGSSSIGFYDMFTLSDKTTTPVIQITKDDIKVGTDVSLTNNAGLANSFVFKQAFKNKLYKLAQAEVDRMLAYARYANKENISIANFDKASQLFYIFPVLNSSNSTMVAIRENIKNGIAPSEADIEFMSGLIADSFKEAVVDEFGSMTKSGLIERKVVKDETGPEVVSTVTFSYPYFNRDYMDRFKNFADKHQGLMAIADLKYNYLRAQVNTLQVLGADPALFMTDKIADKLDMDNPSKAVRQVMDEFSKRAAMFIAPGIQGVWQWQDKNGNLVDRTSYTTITLADAVKDVAKFKKVNTTDAQEFITLQEHIDRLMSEGRIDLGLWQKITDTIEKNKGKFYTLDLTEAEKKVVLQPTKPVHSSNTDVDGFTKIDYVKSSTFPMIPEVLQGTELDKLRQMMENKNIRSANFISAKKTGSPTEKLNVFNEEGDFVDPTDEQLGNSTQTLTREGLRTQQEIPTQKDEINVVSQMDRQLFEGLLDIKDFNFGGQMHTGKDLKTLKENIRIALYYMHQEELMDRLNVRQENGNFVMKNHRGLARLLREEAIARQFDVNDIKAIKVDEKGNLVIPVHLMAKGKRFEGLITSVFSKIVKLKVPGSSMVQVTGVGTKMAESDLNTEIKNQIIYTTAYDPKKGLQYLRKGKDGVQPAQVFVSRYLKDDNGNLIDLSKLATKDESGRLVLDPAKVSKDILQLVGARIPNQGHSSMIPIEVVGFLPAYMENTIIVPDGITAQMGSDFDVDKLYAYRSTLNYTYAPETEKQITALQLKATELKKEYDQKVDDLFKTVLPDDVRKQIEGLKEAKNKLVEKLKYTNLSQGERDNKQKRIDNINGQIEDIYTAVLGKTTEERRAEANREKSKLRDDLRIELEKIDAELEELKKNVESLQSFTYELPSPSVGADGKLETNTDYKSLMGLSETQLLQMYKDLHWAVLTHNKVFDKITKPLEFEDIAKESDLFEQEGLIDDISSYSPLDYESQVKTFIDNRAGKTGTGIYAQMISFIAEHQDKKNIMVGYVDPEGNRHITPVKLLTDDGEELDLYKITAEGKSKTEFGVRTKTDNTSMMLSESVDNAKNKNLYKFNFTSEMMTAQRALIALSSKDGEIADIRYSTRLFSQPIIKTFGRQLEEKRDTLSENSKFVDKMELMNEIKKQHLNLLTEEGKKTYEKLQKNIRLSPKMLLESLKESRNIKPLLEWKAKGEEVSQEQQDRIDSYVLGQLAAADLYMQLDRIGQDLSALMNATNVTTSGIGNSLFAVADKQRKLVKALTGTSVLNALDLVGEAVAYDGTIINPSTQTGHAINSSLTFAKEVLSQVAPLHFDSEFNRLRTKVVAERNPNASIMNYGKAKFMLLSEELMNAFYGYAFTSPELGIVKDVESDRQRLLFGDATQKSLGQRILDAKEKHKWLETNYFLNRLRLDLPKNGLNDPFLIKYRNPFSQDLDELSNNKGFLELILSGDEELISIARDLIVYPFVTGYNQGFSSYIKYLPVELFLLNTKYINGINKFQEILADSYNSEAFYKQFIQNNPQYARRIPQAIFKSVFQKQLTTDTEITLDPKAHESLMVQMTPDEGNGQKFPAFLSKIMNGKWILYEKQGAIDSPVYRRVNTLGDGVVAEYNSQGEATTMFFNNLTYTEKLGKLISNPNNPYAQIPKINVDVNRRYISMGNIATQMIGVAQAAVGKDKVDVNNRMLVHTKAWTGKTNTGMYTSDDVVMIAGNTFSDLIPITDADQKYLPADQVGQVKTLLETLFDNVYKPLIDDAAKAGADFVSTNMSGIDENTKNYLVSKGFTQILTAEGFSYYTNPVAKASEPQVNDIDDNDVPTVDDMFFSNAEDAADPANTMFGIEFAQEDESENRDEVFFAPDIEADPIQTDEDIVSKYVKNTKKLATLKSVMTNLSKNTTNEFYRTLGEVMKKAGFEDVKVVITEAIKNPGEYDPNSRTISINPTVAMSDSPNRTKSENLEDVIIHEVIHAYTAHLLNTDTKSLNERERVYVASLKGLYKTVFDKVSKDPQHSDKLRDVLASMNNEGNYLTPSDKSMYYGLTNVNEFASMLMSDKTFQEFMNNIQVQESTNLTALERFKQLLVKLFRTLAEAAGIKIKSGSALEQGVNDIFNLITAPTTPGSTETQASLFSTATSKIDNYSLDSQCK